MAKNKEGSITAAYEKLPRLIKVILQIFFGGIIGGVYRIIRFFETHHVITLIAGILTLFTGVGNLIAWVVDLITELFSNKIRFFAA